MKITPELYTKAYTRGIQSALKGLATDGSDLHENYTPTVICDMMLDKLDLTQPKSILILYNLELLFALRLRKYTGPVTFFTQSPTKAEIAPKFLPGVAVEYIDKEENPLYFMETKWPEKFDIVVANPPYSRKLDLKFLDKAFDVAKEEVVFVTPSSHYMQKKGTNNLFNLILEKTTKCLKSLTFFNGNPIFKINLFVPCVITHIEKNNKGPKFILENQISGQEIEIEKDKIGELYYFGYNNKVDSIKIKTTSTAQTLKDISTVLGFKGDQSHRKVLSYHNNYFVEFTHVRGHIESEKNKMVKDDYFTFFKKDTWVKRGVNPTYNIWFEFSTEIEAINFIKFCKTDFARFCLFLGKFSQSIAQNELAYVPAMDFTQEWTDEKLYAHFGITEEEQAFIKDVIPPYYDTEDQAEEPN